jgi:hypothetical protein
MAACRSPVGKFLFINWLRLNTWTVPWISGWHGAARQTRQRSSPHIWHWKQSGQGCFLAAGGDSSGTKTRPFMLGAGLKPMVVA